ncbi:MAG: hypothetical protein ACE361_00940 [Aureliella sp.]
MTLLDDATLLCEELPILSGIQNEDFDPFEGAMLEKVREQLIDLTDSTIRLKRALDDHSVGSLDHKLKSIQYKLPTQFAPSGTSYITTAAGQYLGCFHSLYSYGKRHLAIGYRTDLRTLELEKFERLPKFGCDWDVAVLQNHVAGEWHILGEMPKLNGSRPPKPNLDSRATVKKPFVDVLWEEMEEKDGEWIASKSKVMGLVYPTDDEKQRAVNFKSIKTRLAKDLREIGYCLGDDPKSIYLRKLPD